MCVCVCKTFYWSNEGNTGQPTVSDDDLMISKIHTQFFIKLNFSLCLATIHFLLILSIENLLNKVILCVSRVRHSTRVVKWRELVNYCRFGKQTESVVENKNASTISLWQTSFWKISKVHLKCDLLLAVECVFGEKIRLHVKVESPEINSVDEIQEESNHIFHFKTVLHSYWFDFFHQKTAENFQIHYYSWRLEIICRIGCHHRVVLAHNNSPISLN